MVNPSYLSGCLTISLLQQEAAHQEPFPCISLLQFYCSLLSPPVLVQYGVGLLYQEEDDFLSKAGRTVNIQPPTWSANPQKRSELGQVDISSCVFSYTTRGGHWGIGVLESTRAVLGYWSQRAPPSSSGAGANHGGFLHLVHVRTMRKMAWKQLAMAGQLVQLKHKVATRALVADD